MDFERIKEIFGKHVDGRVKMCQVKLVCEFLFCPVAIALAVALIYALLRVFDREGYLSHSACFWIATAAIPVMFLGNRMTPRGESLMEKRMREGAPMTSGAVNRGVVLGNVFLWNMFAGPRLVNWSFAPRANHVNGMKWMRTVARQSFGS